VKKSAMSAELASVLEQDAGVASRSENVLVTLRNKIAEVRELDARIKDAEEAVAELKRKRWSIVGHFNVSGELVAMLQSAGVPSLSIEAAGNYPAYEANLKTLFTAKLPEDDRRDKALRKFRWLEGLTKTQYKVDFSKGQGKLAKKFQSLLKKQKIVDYEVKVGVHSSTLTAEIRRRFSDGEPLSPADMELLGAATYPVVELTEVKGLKTNGKGQRQTKD